MHETLGDVAMGRSELLSECIPPTRNRKVATETTQEEAKGCQTQLDKAFKRYFVPSRQGEERDVIVAHGNVIRYFVTKALGVDTQAWLSMSVAHASLTVIRVEADGSFVVLSVGDVGHLPPNMQSGTGGANPELSVPRAP